MKFKYGDDVVVIKGRQECRVGKVVEGSGWLFTEVLFNNQHIISHTILTSRLELIGV